MDADKQRVLGIFLEGAQDNLDTLERGIINLRAAISDSEQLNEMFRAAHSVKGDAAMLNLTSINKVAHRLEDCFKILQDLKAPVDQQVESLFLRGFDTLSELVERLKGPYGLPEDEAQRMVQDVEPAFGQLQDYLRSLVGAPVAVAQAVPPRFASLVTEALRDMLQQFRQPESAPGRQQLVQICERLQQLDPGVEAWTALIHTTKRAIQNPETTYKALAPVIIKEIKEASDLIVANRGRSVVPSAALQQFAGPEPLPVAAAKVAAPKDEICVPRDPKRAAQMLVQSFDRKQLVELTNTLIRTLKGQG